jgi:hypothetical protein
MGRPDGIQCRGRENTAADDHPSSVATARLTLRRNLRQGRDSSADTAVVQISACGTADETR